MPRRPAALAAGVLLLLCSVSVSTAAGERTVTHAAADPRPVPAPDVATPATDGPERRPGAERRRTVSVAPLVGRPDRPNVLVIMTDDARNDELRFLPHVRHLIGDQGVTFTNTFSPQPLCCPARASSVMITSTFGRPPTAGPVRRPPG